MKHFYPSMVRVARFWLATCWALCGLLLLVLGATPALALTPLSKVETISPNRGPVGTAVTITGKDLGRINQVLFNGTSVYASNISPTTTSATNGTGTVVQTTVQVVVPAGATTGQVEARNNNEAGVTTGGPVFTVTTPPELTTAAGTGVTGTSAVLGGTVTANGGETVTERGVVYSATNQTPTTADARQANGAGLGSFSQTIGGLTAGTTYYVRAYAINSVGTGYGPVQAVTTVSNTVVSVRRADPSTSNAGTVRFTVTYGTSMTGLSASNFALTQTGSLGASIALVAGSGGIYTVTVNVGTGEGTVRLDVANNAGVSPNITNLPYTGGETYTLDRIVPTVVLSSTAGSTTGTTPIPFTATFSESVTGFSHSDVQITNGYLYSLSGSGTNYSFAVMPSAAGLVTVNVPANAAQDAVSNGNAAATPLSVQYAQVQTAAPVLTAPANGGMARSPVYVSGSSVPNSSVSIYLDNVLYGTLPVGSTGTFGVPAGQNLAHGSTHSVYLKAQSSGQAVSAPSATHTFTIDAERPSLAISSSAGASGSSTATAPIPLTFTFSENVTNFSAGYVVVTGGTVSNFAGSGAVYNATLTPYGPGTMTVDVQDYVALDVVGNLNTAAPQFRITYALPPTTAPIVTAPANGSRLNNTFPTYTGTAPANAVVVVYVNGNSVGSATASGTGAWSATGYANLPEGDYTVYATAWLSGQSTSPNSATNSFTIDTTPPAAPVVTAPANGSTLATATPTYTGTAEAGSTVAVLVDNAAIGTTAASGSGAWSFTQPTALSQTQHTVQARATDVAGNTGSISAANTFGVQLPAPTVVLSSTVANGGGTQAGEVTFLAQFSENVGTSFNDWGISVSGGYVSSFVANTLPANSYTFRVARLNSTPVTATVRIMAGAARSVATGNNNTASAPYSFAFQQATIARVRSVTVQLTAAGTGTLTAGSVNNGSSGAGTLTYTIQKVVAGAVEENRNLVLTAPNGATFVSVPFASFGSPSEGSPGNYALGACHAANSVTTARNAFVGRTTGVMSATSSAGSAGNSPLLGDPCPGTRKHLAVQAAYSADAASQPFTCADAGQTRSVLLTVTDSNGNTATALATVTVVAPPAATVPSSPAPAVRGATVAVAGTSLSGLTAATLNGAALTIGSLTDTGFTFEVPATAAIGTGTLALTLPCAQTLSVPFEVLTSATAAPVVTLPGNYNIYGTTTPFYLGTAPAGATVTVVVDGNIAGTTVAYSNATWDFTSPTPLAEGAHTVYATAQQSGQTPSVPSATVNFFVDTLPPTVVVSSAAGSPTSASPIVVAVTFSEPVTGFVAGDVTVTNGTITGFAGSGASYTLRVTPTAAGLVTVSVPANVAEDILAQGNTAAAPFSIMYDNTVRVVAVTRLTPSPTATTSVQYQVLFSGPVTGLSAGNFTVATTGNLSGLSVIRVAGADSTYTVTLGTGTGEGTLRLNVGNGTGLSAPVSNVPYATGEVYTVTRSFAARPVLRIQAVGSVSGDGDVTAFVDQVQVRQNGAGYAPGLRNGGFETSSVTPNGYQYAPGVAASPWSFGTQAGVSRNNSGFSSTAAAGDAVAFLQSSGGNHGSVSQTLAVPTGSYQVSLDMVQRNYSAKDQVVHVFLNDVFVGGTRPASTSAYQTLTSAAFNVTAPALVATISTSAGAASLLNPMPFAVTFTQSVDTSFTAADLTVTGGTLVPGSFAGSGSGPYTFTVAPTAAGTTVTVALAAAVALDASHTPNAASSAVSVLYRPAGRVAGNALRNAATASTSTGNTTVGYADFSASPLPVLGPQYSQEVWVKPAFPAQVGLTYNLLGNGAFGSATAAPMLTVGSGGRVFAGFGTGTAFRGIPLNSGNAAALTNNAWNHVVATYDGTTMRIYVNGELNQSVALTGTGAPGTTPITYLGNAVPTGNTFFPGDLDEVSLWNRVLTQAEIRQRRHLVRSGNESGLAAYVQFNESGTAATEALRGTVGTLQGAGAALVASTAPVGSGTSSTQTVAANTTYEFGGTGVSMAFAGVAGSSETVVTRLAGSPLGTAPAATGLATTYTPAYWIVNTYAGGSFTRADVTYSLTPAAISAADEATPANLKLFKRGSNADGAFDAPIAASSASATAGTVTFPVTSFSQTVIGTFGSSPLPVELTAFAATAEGPQAVRLSWTTASEVKSARFEVERSASGSSFAPIGTVAAAGSSAAPRSYNLLDATLPTGATMLYYRLRQIDQDGTFTYSPVRVVTLDKAAPTRLTLAPNPTTGTATLRGAAALAPVQVYDAVGRLVLTATADATGTARLVLPTGQPQGVYVVRTGAQATRLVLE